MSETILKAPEATHPQLYAETIDKNNQTLYIFSDDIANYVDFDKARKEGFEETANDPLKRKEKLQALSQMVKLADGVSLSDVVLEQSTRPDTTTLTIKQEEKKSLDLLEEVSDKIASQTRPKLKASEMPSGEYLQVQYNPETAEITDLAKVIQLEGPSEREIAKTRSMQQRVPSGPIINTIMIPKIPPKSRR